MSRYKHIIKDFASAVDDRYAALYTGGGNDTHAVVASASRCRSKDCPPPPPPPPADYNYPTFARCANDLAKFEDFEIDELDEACDVWTDTIKEPELVGLVWTMFWGDELIVNATAGSKDALVDILVNAISAVRMNLTEYQIQSKAVYNKWETDAKASADKYMSSVREEEIVLAGTAFLSLITMFVPAVSIAIGIAGTVWAELVSLEEVEKRKMAVENIVSGSIDNSYLTEQGKGIMDFMKLLEMVAFMMKADPDRWNYLGQLLIYYVGTYGVSSVPVTHKLVRDDLDRLQRTIIDLQRGYVRAIYNEALDKPSRREVINALLASKVTFVADLMVLGTAGTAGFATVWDWSAGLIRLKSLKSTNPEFFRHDLDRDFQIMAENRADMLKRVKTWEKAAGRIKPPRVTIPRTHEFRDVFELENPSSLNIETLDDLEMGSLNDLETGSWDDPEPRRPPSDKYKNVEWDAGAGEYRIKKGREGHVAKILKKRTVQERYLIAKANTQASKFTKATTASKGLGIAMGVFTVAVMIAKEYEAEKTRDYFIESIELRVKYHAEQLDSTVKSLQLWHNIM